MNERGLIAGLLALPKELLYLIIAVVLLIVFGITLLIAPIYFFVLVFFTVGGGLAYFGLQRIQEAQIFQYVTVAGIFFIMFGLAFVVVNPFSFFGEEVDLLSTNNDWQENLSMENEYMFQRYCHAQTTQFGFYYSFAGEDFTACQQFIQMIKDNQDKYGEFRNSEIGTACVNTEDSDVHQRQLNLDPVYTQPNRINRRISAYQVNLADEVLDNKQVTFTWSNNRSLSFSKNAFDRFFQDSVVPNQTIEVALFTANNGIANTGIDTLYNSENKIGLFEVLEMDVGSNPNFVNAETGTLVVSKEGVFVNNEKIYDVEVLQGSQTTVLRLVNVETGAVVTTDELYFAHLIVNNNPSNCGTDSQSTRTNVVSNVSVSVTTGGSPVSTTPVTCATGEVLVNGVCVADATDPTCATGGVLVNGVCVADATDSEPVSIIDTILTTGEDLFRTDDDGDVPPLTTQEQPSLLDGFFNFFGNIANGINSFFNNLIGG